MKKPKYKVGDIVRFVPLAKGEECDHLNRLHTQGYAAEVVRIDRVSGFMHYLLLTPGSDTYFDTEDHILEIVTDAE